MINTTQKAFDSLDIIYNKIEAASDNFEINYTYLNTLNLILKDSKIRYSRKDRKIKPFIMAYNKLLDDLYKACKKQSKQMNDKNKLHLVFVKQYIDIIKKNLK